MVKIKIKSKEPVYQEKKRGKTFEYYPEFNDPNFYEKIYTKKEFYKNEIPVQTKTAEEICKAMPFELAPQQQFLRNYISVDTPYNGVLIYHKTGVGKCLAYDTPVLMMSGEFKKVQNLQVGDYLMGDDSQGREILSLARGIDKMYKINIENGISFTVNSEHIICVRPEHPQIIKKNNDTYYVKYLDEMKIKKDRFSTLNEAEIFSNRIESQYNSNIIEIEVKDFIKLKKNVQSKLKHYFVPVEFPEKNVEINPYQFATNLIKKDEIPFEYKSNTTFIRNQLLAGIIDNYGTKNEDNEFVIKNSFKQGLKDDIRYLVKSLGYNYTESTDNKIIISGNNLFFIPVKKEENIINKEQQKVDRNYNQRLLSFNVKFDRVDNYYGFTIDGNGRFLLEDFVVTHNTCTAIQIAEGFKEIMKRMHSDSRRKIIVLLGRRIKDNFRNQIYNIEKESLKKRPDDIVQCTGNTYSLDFEQFKSFTLSQKKRETNKLINNNYKFYGYEQFGNEIMNLIGWDGKLDSLTDAQKNAIRTQFQNRVIIIDEFQNIKSDTSNVELKKVPPILRAIIKYAENIRLVLMSATPMYDSAGEIIFILNLLLENDGKPPIKKNEILDANDRLVPGGEKRLLEVSKGYISYLSGENPITFPLKIEAAPSKVFKDIIYDIKGNLIPMQDRFRNIKLYPCEMSPYQYKQYQNKLNSNNGNSNNLYEENDNLNNNQNNRKNSNKKPNDKKNNNKNENSHAKNQPLFYLSNIVLPNKNFENTLARREGHAYQKIDNGEGPFIISERVNPMLKKKYFQFKYQNHVKFDLGKKEETSFLDEKHLGKFSTKYLHALKNIKYGKGICYVYSEFKWGGVLPFALMLEQNGFERYRVEGEKSLLDYPVNRNGGGGKRNPICALCGKERLNKVHTNKKEKGFHEFKTAKYILVTGDVTLTKIETGQLLDIVNNSNNKNGEEVKVVIGTKTTGEGLDFQKLRQVHILEPWYNLSRIEQTIGRAIRYCSHLGLPVDERNSEVFLYATTPPSTATKKEKQTETIDSRFYRIAENKDVKIKAVEHVLKRAAVDCALNRNGNVPKFDKTINALTSSGRKLKIKLGNKDYSRECDYEKCDYKCVWMPEKGKHYKINIDTYNERFARTDIENAKRIIKKLYQTWYVYELEDLINAVRKKMKKLEVEFIYQGINELIDNINEPVYDQYDRKGYLIYRGTYYVYQPLEFNYLQSPLWYRTVPINEKAPFYLFENELQNYNNVNVVKNEKQVSSKQLLENLLAKAEQLYQDIPYRDKEKMYIILGMLIDPLDYKEKTNILKIVLSNYYDTKGKMDNVYYSDILKYMDGYLIFKERDLEYGKERNNKKDKIIGYTINGKYFCYNFDTRLFSECSTDIKDKIKLSRKIRATKESKLDSKAFNNIYGFMEKWKNGKFVFKIFDGTKETGALTLNKSRSKRSEIKGKKCETFSSSELNDISKKLHIDIKAKQIKLICRNIEYSLRLYNLQNKNNLRWFRYADS